MTGRAAPGLFFRKQADFHHIDEYSSLVITLIVFVVYWVYVLMNMRLT